MQTVAFINRKGGSGKSSLVIHLAVAAAQSGRNIGVIDLDSNASTMKWRDRRHGEELPVVVSAHASRLPQQMAEMRGNGADLLFLDTVGSASADTLAAVEAADLVVVPTEPSIIDMEQTTSTIKLLKTLRTPYFVVLTKVPPSGSEGDEGEEFLRDTHHTAVCPARLVYRKAFKNALIEGKGATEWTDDKAAAEAANVYKFISDQLDKLTSEHTTKTTSEHDNLTTKEHQHG